MKQQIANQQCKRYLLWFAHEHVEFRQAEMDSIIQMFQLNLRFILKSKDHPFWIIETGSEGDLEKIASRSVLLRHCIEIWSHSNSIAGLHSNLKEHPQDEIKSYLSTTFKVIVETFCKHFTQKEKVQKIETFSYLPITGSVKLDNPEQTLYYIEYYGSEPNDIPEEPMDVFFGRLIASGQRDKIQKLSLKTRKFIGNTSMDPQLSILMANQAQAKSGDLVLDPFVGTGSLLISASMFGAYTLGTDIDFLMLHGRTRPTRITQKKREKDESIKSNMNQYGLESLFLDVVVADFSQPLWRNNIKFDAIIADPPYGVRESVERIGSPKDNPFIEKHLADSHIPSKVIYELWELFTDLLTFSAECLKTNGRLVFWFPVFREHYSEDQLPVHPCFELFSVSEQILSTYASRLLLTYTKIKDPQDDDPPCKIGAPNFRDQYFHMRERIRAKKLKKKASRELL